MTENSSTQRAMRNCPTAAGIDSAASAFLRLALLFSRPEPILLSDSG